MAVIWRVPGELDMLHDSIRGSIHQPSEELLERLLLGLNSEAMNQLVRMGDALEAIAGWVVGLDVRPSIHIFPEGHDLFISTMKFSYGFDLDDRRSIFDLLWFGLGWSSFLGRSFLLDGGSPAIGWLLLVPEHFLFQEVMDRLGSGIVLGIVELFREAIECFIFEAKKVEEAQKQLLVHLLREAIL